MERAIMINQMNADQLNALFAGLSEKISKIENTLQPQQSTDYLTRDQVARMLDVDLSTLYLWAKKGKLLPVGIGNRVYYRRSDIDAALTPLNS
jgi:excisionase family DNA binding protein